MSVKTVHSNQKTKMSSAAWLWRVSFGLAGLGLLVSLYLTWIKVANTSAFCGGAGDCESVNASRYSEVGGIPIAAMGAAVYAAILILLAVEPRSEFWRQWSPIAVFGLGFAGTLYSAYLTYIEIAVLHAICPYCVVSAIAVTSVFVISVVRLWRSNSES